MGPNVRNALGMQYEWLECTSMWPECTMNFHSNGIRAHSDSCVTRVLRRGKKQTLVSCCAFFAVSIHSLENVATWLWASAENNCLRFLHDLKQSMSINIWKRLILENTVCSSLSRVLPDGVTQYKSYRRVYTWHTSLESVLCDVVLGLFHDFNLKWRLSRVCKMNYLLLFHIKDRF